MSFLQCWSLATFPVHQQSLKTITIFEGLSVIFLVGEKLFPSDLNGISAGKCWKLSAAKFQALTVKILRDWVHIYEIILSHKSLFTQVLGLVHITPENFENDVSILEIHQMFFVHTINAQFWICVWGKLGRWNHMIIASHRFPISPFSWRISVDQRNKASFVNFSGVMLASGDHYVIFPKISYHAPKIPTPNSQTFNVSTSTQGDRPILKHVLTLSLLSWT